MLIAHLIGGPCAGEYETQLELAPKILRAVYGGGLLKDGAPAVLDLPDDEPEPGEQLVEYELAHAGIVCTRGRGGCCSSVATYYPAGWTQQQRMKAVARALGPDLSVVK